MMKVGYGVVDITPPMGIVMGGHPGTKLAQSISKRLYVRSMVIYNGEQTVVFSSVDTLFVGDDSVARIKETIRETGILDPDHLFVSATHTHSGPLTAGLFGQDCEGDYLPKMEKGVEDSIRFAFEDLRPCELYHAGSFVNDMAFCARFIMRGNRIETHPFKYDKDIVAAESAPDTSLNVMYSVDESGSINGMMVNFAQHPQIMERENPAISADFPAFLEEHICDVLQRHIPVLFFNGACGDVCPVNAVNPETCEVGEAWCKNYGYRLADSVLRILDQGEKLSHKITVSKRNIVLKLRTIPEEKICAARTFMKKNKDVTFVEPLISNYGVEKSEENASSLEKYLQLDCWKAQEYTDILYLLRCEEACSQQSVDVALAVIGDFAIVTMPFEVFGAIGIHIKENSKYQKTAVFELTNGTAGYLPTEQAFDRPGSYETLTLYSSRYAENSDKVVENQVIDLINHGAAE